MFIYERAGLFIKLVEFRETCVKEGPSLRTMQTLSNNKVSILSGFLLSLGGDTLNFK